MRIPALLIRLGLRIARSLLVATLLVTLRLAISLLRIGTGHGCGLIWLLGRLLCRLGNVCGQTFYGVEDTAVMLAAINHTFHIDSHPRHKLVKLTHLVSRKLHENEIGMCNSIAVNPRIVNYQFSFLIGLATGLRLDGN